MFLVEGPKNRGSIEGKTGTKEVPVLDNTPTLRDLGIDKKTSARSQRLAALPDDVFEAVPHPAGEQEAEATGGLTFMTPVLRCRGLPFPDELPKFYLRSPLWCEWIIKSLI